MSKPKNFAENGALKKAYNDSLFESLFRQRKKVIESYPKVGGGLSIPDIPVKLGDASYTFSTRGTADKLNLDHKDLSCRARYKRDVQNFDILLKQRITNTGVEGLVAQPALKYASASGKPVYVFGCGLTYRPQGFECHAKFNPWTMALKGSCLYDCKDYGVKVAADVKSKLDGQYKDCKWNTGVAYALPSAMGLVTLAVNQNKDVTATYTGNSGKINFCAETVLRGKDQSIGATAGVGTQVDKEHEVRARVNDELQLNVAVKKNISSKFSLSFATLVDLKKPDTGVPAFGFKVDSK